MDANRLRNLAFLMSLGGVSCFHDSGPRTTAGAGTDGTTGTTTTGGPDPASDASTSVPLTDSGTTTTTGTTEPATTTTGTTGPTDTTDTTGTTGTDTTGTTGGPPGNPVCESYGAKIVECVPRYAAALPEIIGYCDKTIKNGTTIDGEVCQHALEDYFACLTGLPCRNLFMEWDMPYTQCMTQGMAIEAGCPNYEF